jgi:hypothetical protein
MRTPEFSAEESLLGRVAITATAIGSAKRFPRSSGRVVIPQQSARGPICRWEYSCGLCDPSTGQCGLCVWRIVCPGPVNIH